MQQQRIYTEQGNDRKTAQAWIRTLESKARQRKTQAMRWYYSALANELARNLNLDILRAEGDLIGCLLALSGKPEIQTRSGKRR